MFPESAKAQDARVEKLWKTVDVKNRGSLDIDSLRAGLRRLDHPLQNADDLLQNVLDKIDSDRDGHITFQEFRTFVKHTESKLWNMFESIDRNHDGRIEKEELQLAMRQAGLAVPQERFEEFFNQVDADHNGDISFEEWRNFLLFIPTLTPDLEAVLSYFSATVRLSPEGDVVLSDDTVDGLGNKTSKPPSSLHTLLKPFFGVLFEIASPPPQIYHPPPPYMSHPEDDRSRDLKEDYVYVDSHDFEEDSPGTDHTSMKLVLMSCIPSSGYFAAGGVAGIISRTATAPLDRLKVYLIAQTGDGKPIAEAAKKGAPLQALRGAWRTSALAMRELWAAGGIRSLYAGNGLNIVKVMPESAIKFGTYEAMKRLCARIEGHSNPQSNSASSKFISGGVSGMASQFFVYPLDTLKFRMQCETVSGGLKGNRLILATASKMWSETGMRAFYRGLPMGLIGMFPYAAIDLGTFEYLKRRITLRNARIRGCSEEEAMPGSFFTALIGGFSGALGASLVYPLNLLRTRLQSQGTVLHPRSYTGITDVFNQTIKGEGVKGLFKGLTPNLLKVVPAVSITYVVYENAKKALHLR